MDDKKIVPDQSLYLFKHSISMTNKICIWEKKIIKGITAGNIAT